MRATKAFALLAAAVFMMAAVGARAAPGDGIYAGPARLVAAPDGARLNLVCTGAGSPAVIFDSGFGDWAPAWAVVQPKIAAFTRACSYDRAGTGFSKPGPAPRVTATIAAELHAVLAAGGVPGPYVLVGSAFGGDHVRAFADLYPRDVAGLVLVDADASDVSPPALRRKDDAGDLAFVADLRACRDAVATGAPARAAPGGSARACQSLLFRGLPESQWSAELNAALLRLAATKVELWDALVSEMANMPADETWLAAHRRFLGATPVRVLTSGHHGEGHLERPRPASLDHLRYEYETALAQSRWLTLSTDARQSFPPPSSEYIQFDQPQVVVDAVREIVDHARRRP